MSVHPFSQVERKEEAVPVSSKDFAEFLSRLMQAVNLVEYTDDRPVKVGRVPTLAILQQGTDELRRNYKRVMKKEPTWFWKRYPYMIQCLERIIREAQTLFEEEGNQALDGALEYCHTHDDYLADVVAADRVAPAPVASTGVLADDDAAWLKAERFDLVTECGGTTVYLHRRRGSFFATYCPCSLPYR